MKIVLAAVATVALVAVEPRSSPAELARKYADAVRELNEKHARAPGSTREEELAKKLPAAARKAFDELLATKKADELAQALVVAAEAAADLDLGADFEKARGVLERLSKDESARLGLLESRERFVVRATNGLSREYAAHFADVFEAILGAYDELYGFDELSKVPGKKLRVLVHLEQAIERPPHFAPEFPFHSQIDFPVDDAEGLRSPTTDGKFLFYGLCHELGHVVAMWGDAQREADHHAWAHYTGVAVVEHLAQDPKRAKLLADLKDVKWRSLEKEREASKSVQPSLDTREGTLALLIALHDAVGPQALGAALDALDAKDQRLRINRVRYYEFDDFEKALCTGLGDAAQRARVEALFR